MVSFALSFAFMYTYKTINVFLKKITIALALHRSQHPNFVVVKSGHSFLEKIERGTRAASEMLAKLGVEMPYSNVPANSVPPSPC